MWNNETFEPLIIYPDPLGGTAVHWSLRSAFSIPGPYIFWLQWAESDAASDEVWANVNSTPVLDGYMDVDPMRRAYNKTPEIAYRVVLEAGGSAYRSEPKVPYGNWNGHDYLIARDIVRKERLLASKYTGERGWLRKRKIWGPKCTSCIDENLDTSENERCPVCYGTGIIGGYFRPYETFFTPSPESRYKKVDATTGQVQPMSKTVRALAFPQLDRGDLWFSDGSGRRYYLHTVQNLAEMRGIPLVCQVELRQVPFSDPVHDIPFDVPSSPGMRMS